jgi:hypothetical protein
MFLFYMKCLFIYFQNLVGYHARGGIKIFEMLRWAMIQKRWEPSSSYGVQSELRISLKSSLHLCNRPSEVATHFPSLVFTGTVEIWEAFVKLFIETKIPFMFSER